MEGKRRSVRKDLATIINTIGMKERIWFIFGADEFFVELRAKKCLEEQTQGFSLETIDGTVNTIADLKQVVDRVVEALQTADFFTHAVRGGKFLYSAVYGYDAARVRRFFTESGNTWRK